MIRKSFEKRATAVTLAAVLAFGGVTAGCSNKGSAQKGDGALNSGATTEASTEMLAENPTQEQTAATQAPTSATTQAPTEAPTPEPTSAPTQAAAKPQERDEKDLGVSARGYSIKVVRGITYVNGILIANKTYALPSTYAPGGLDRTVQEAFNKMKGDAAKEGLTLWIASGYRSYDYQKNLYNRYVASDGQAKADTYSARAGHSEHQTGLCFDLNQVNDTFANTPESAWVNANAHKYGFIVRYPKGKESITGYKYEPWHLRYLGVELATSVYNSGLCLEEYLGITSVYQN